MDSYDPPKQTRKRGRPRLTEPGAGRLPQQRDRHAEQSRDKPPTTRQPRPGGWQPGKSGNPAGRPNPPVPDRPGDLLTAEQIRALTRIQGPRCVEILAGLLEHKEWRARALAAQVLLDRGYGKAEQRLNLTEPQDSRDEAIRARLERLRANPATRQALLVLAEAEAAGEAAPVAAALPGPVVATVPAASETALPSLGASQERFHEPGAITLAAQGQNAPEWLLAALARFPRLALTGGPKVGKTTIASAVSDRTVIHTDAYAHLGWSEASAAVAEAVNAMDGPLLVEGVAVPRAMRKGARVDAVVWLHLPHEPLTPEQAAMAKGCRTVLDEVTATWQREDPAVGVTLWITPA